MAGITSPRVLLHVEGFALLAASILLYGQAGGNWWMFVLLLLVPDVSLLGYLAGTNVGAFTYNLVHTALWPAGLAVFGLLSASPLAVQLALIWLAHIGMDRTVGYGLKYPTAQKGSHLQKV
ncbi:MAG TPA: DUF4260 domain-containing protein [Chloroflexia bacterium]|nr:DUF4260 domain-containing protein [Chloroflexia bacterium]